MRRKNPPKIRNSIAIVVDGKTEAWYFRMLQKNETQLRINLEPIIPQKKTLVEQYKKVKELSEDYEYDVVFWIIDLDTIAKETRECNKNRKSPLDELKEYINEIKNNYSNIISIINNPCLEFWFLLHFDSLSKYFKSCDDVEKLLISNKFLPGYEKSERFYKKANQDIYFKLKNRLNTAIINSKKIKLDIDDSISVSVSEMHKFFEYEALKSSYI